MRSGQLLSSQPTCSGSPCMPSRMRRQAGGRAGRQGGRSAPPLSLAAPPPPAGSTHLVIPYRHQAPALLPLLAHHHRRPPGAHPASVRWVARNLRVGCRAGRVSAAKAVPAGGGGRGRGRGAAGLGDWRGSSRRWTGTTLLSVDMAGGPVDLAGQRNQRSHTSTGDPVLSFIPFPRPSLMNTRCLHCGGLRRWRRVVHTT